MQAEQFYVAKLRWAWNFSPSPWQCLFKCRYASHLPLAAATAAVLSLLLNNSKIFSLGLVKKLILQLMDVMLGAALSQLLLVCAPYSQCSQSRD